MEDFYQLCLYKKTNILKCCIPKCKTTRMQGKLFKFPHARELYPLWETIIKQNYPDIKLTKDREGRCQKYVCYLHFEKKFIDEIWGNRLRFAVPTLFSQTEIETGKPICPLPINGREVPDHFVITRRLLDNGLFHVLDHPYAFNEDLERWRLLKEKIKFDSERVPDHKGDAVDIPREPSPRVVSPNWEHCNEVYEDDRRYSSEQYERLPFSWQNSDDSIAVEDHVSNLLNLDVTEENAKDENVNRKYCCNNCMKEIICFRYTCVQCVNFDLCCSCESKLLHPHHYMLRVPEFKSINEVKTILDAIRDSIKMLTDSGHCVGVEIKQEAETMEEPEALPEARVETPTELLDSHSYPAHSDEDQEQYAPDVSSDEEDEPEIAISETEEWLDELVCSEDDQLGDQVQTLPDSPILVPGTEAERWPPSEAVPPEDPLSTCDDIPLTNSPHLDTNRQNIATELSPLEHRTPHLSLSPNAVELPSIDNISLDECQDSQSEDENSRLSDYIPTGEMRAKRKLLMMRHDVSKRNKTINIEEQYTKRNYGLEQSYDIVNERQKQSNNELKSVTNPNTPDDIEATTDSEVSDNVEHARGFEQNLLDIVNRVPIIKLNRLGSVIKPKPPGIVESKTTRYSETIGSKSKSKSKTVDDVEVTTLRQPDDVASINTRYNEKAGFEPRFKSKQLDDVASIHTRNKKIIGYKPRSKSKPEDDIEVTILKQPDYGAPINTLYKEMVGCKSRIKSKQIDDVLVPKITQYASHKVRVTSIPIRRASYNVRQESITEPNTVDNVGHDSITKQNQSHGKEVNLVRTTYVMNITNK